MEKFHYNLNLLLEEIWEMLEKGAKKSKNDFHLGVISTVQNSISKSRTVVLRKVLPRQNILIFHTDRRSGKINELLSNPNISWLFYSKEKKVQLRLEGKALVHNSGKIFDKQWNNSKLMSKICYITEPDPGSKLIDYNEFLEDTTVNGEINQKNIEEGKMNFSVVETRINSIEWLYLRSSGHIRAKYNLTEESFKGEWIAP